MSRRLQPFVWIGGVLLVIEGMIWAIGTVTGNPTRFRMALIGVAGFWPGLLGDWQSNFRLQPVSMFATYWLIHAGPAHLIGNLGVMVWLAQRIGPSLRRTETVEIWAASVFGGAAAYGLLSTAPAPMIGASGGVFGLLGAWVVLDYHRAQSRDGLWRAALRTALVCGAILVLSVVDYRLRDAILAWQAHLGGFLAGGLLTATAGIRPARARR